MASRVPFRARVGQRTKNTDENAASKLRQTSTTTISARGVPGHAGKPGVAVRRPVLNEVTTTAVNRKVVPSKGNDKYAQAGDKHPRPSSVATTTHSAASTVHLPTSQSHTGFTDVPRRHHPLPAVPQRVHPHHSTGLPTITSQNLATSATESDCHMDIEELEQEVEAMIEVADSDDEEAVVSHPLDSSAIKQEYIWPAVSPIRAERYAAEVKALRKQYQEEEDQHDVTMVSEYADEIFQYMTELEDDAMPSPTYMDDQNEITWAMRQTLIDWLLQVHFRYHMLPETLWIAVNIMDRFLSRRVVSLVKLQLVGVTAMFIASKYEEVLAPSVDEFVFMTEKGYTKKEILKGERIVLQTLDFQVSHYCSPYSWMRKISKADDYDIQTRTLSKFLAEVALVDYRFIRVKPSMVAAVGMYTARRMLGGDWNDAFVYHSGFTEEHLMPGCKMLLEKLNERDFAQLYVYKKYAQKKFLKAAVFAIDKAREMMGSAVYRGDTPVA